MEVKVNTKDGYHGVQKTLVVTMISLGITLQKHWRSNNNANRGIDIKEPVFSETDVIGASSHEWLVIETAWWFQTWIHEFYDVHFIYGMSSQPHWRTPSFFKIVF